MVFETASYFASHKTASFYPSIEVLFTIKDDQHYHVPLLLNPFGYSTYRGS
jgi:5-hydroxyisourate hydrolase-like protein (transthyretin family)